MLSAGEIALSPTITDAHVIQDKKKGSPVEWVALEPAFVILGQMVLPVQAQHPHAALLYLDLELSREVAGIYESIGFDVLLDPLPSEDEMKGAGCEEKGCTACFELDRERYRIIYTRAKQAGEA